MKNKFIDLVSSAVSREAIKKLIFSRPMSSDVKKVSARLCAHRGKRILSLEYFLPSNTVSQKNIKEEDVKEELSLLLSEYMQANLLTTLGDAEWKTSKGGKEVLLGADKLSKKLMGEAPSFESAIEALDKKKNYILSGDEEFLKVLGISDKNGRVHDKKQGKFRQINRFLEHIETIYDKLPTNKELTIYDLCSGKSYLSFAVYHYFCNIKKRTLRMLGIDLKGDVIKWCDGVAKELGYSGMSFICDDITNTPKNTSVDMVISLHACDVATDIVIDTAMLLNAGIILSTPCCHKYLNDKINVPALSFITDYPHLKNKLCEAATDAIRLARMRAGGYNVAALELTDPDDTPKNTLLRAIKCSDIKESELNKRRLEYDALLTFLLCENKDRYLKDF